jgi:hypothetical protein
MRVQLGWSAAGTQHRTQFIGFGMSMEQSKILESRLQRLVELRWQREVIARWLAGSGTPVESQSQLEEMFAQVNAELRALEGTPDAGEGETNIKQAN